MINQQRRFRSPIPAVRRHAPVWLALAVLLAWAPGPAHAEGFFDLYLGVGFPQDSDVDTSADDPFVDSRHRLQLRDVDWETSPSFGMRGGYWFGEYGPSFIGVGLDLSYYQAFEDSSFAELEVAVTPMTPLLMLRDPARLRRGLSGRPGATVRRGRAGLHARLCPRRARRDPPSNPPDCAPPPAHSSTTISTRPGSASGSMRARGSRSSSARRFALFGEYRYTYVEPEFEEDLEVASSPFGFETEVEFEPELADAPHRVRSLVPLLSRSPTERAR